ncbi:hypothetical protein Tco_0123698 [Tanacetum coccineum]
MLRTNGYMSCRLCVVRCGGLWFGTPVKGRNTMWHDMICPVVISIGPIWGCDKDDVITEQAVKESSRTAGGRRKISLARKRARETLSEESAKKQKLEDDTEKEEFQVYLNIVPEEESLDVESLATKQDVLELYRLVNERFQTASPSGYDLLLWGDLKTLIEPNEEDEIWRNQQDWNLINWKLHNFYGVHILLMDTGLVIHMMVEKKYPLSQYILSKMLSRKLEVDHQIDIGYELIKFVKSQLQQ